MTQLSNSRSGARIPELDGVRGVAILMVVLYHFFWESGERSSGTLPHLIGSVLVLGWSGVDLFFVLSGFLIGGILLDHRRSANYFKTFYIRRACRILPLYFLWVALFFAIPLFLSQSAPAWCSAQFEQQDPTFPKWGYIFLLQNFFAARKAGFIASAWFGVTWSLAVEEQFYIVLPTVIRFLLPRKPVALLICLIVLVPIFRAFMFMFHPELCVYMLLPGRADGLLLGVLCAYLVRDEDCRRCVERNWQWIYSAFVVLFSGVIALTIFGNAIVKGQEFNLLNSYEMTTVGYFWIALFYACLLLLVVTVRTGPLAGLMRAGVLRHFGLIAYGIYLIHMWINTLAHGLIVGTGSLVIVGIPSFAATIVAFLATWLIAWLSWNFLEKPIVRWGHSFTYTSRGGVAPEPVASNPVIS